MPNHNTKPRMSSRPISIRNLRARVYRMHMESLQLYRDLEAHPNKHHVDAFQPGRRVCRQILSGTQQCPKRASRKESVMLNQHPQYDEARNIKDPVERWVALALCFTTVTWIKDYRSPNNDSSSPRTLDFYIPEWDTYIECKRFHTDRVDDQMRHIENFIVIQGIGAANMFYAALQSATKRGISEHRKGGIA